MEVLIPILIALLIFVIAVWAIGILPMPAAPEGKQPFPLRTILYVLAAVVLIIFLLRFI